MIADILTNGGAWKSYLLALGLLAVVADLAFGAITAEWPLISDLGPL